MTSEQQQVREWMKAFGQETPEKPTVPSLEVRKLRAKIKLEECLETIDALGIGIEIRIAINDSDSNFVLLNDLDFDKDFFFSAYGEPDLIKIADGCEDLKVVTEGTLVACGLITKTEQVYVSDDQHDWIEDRPIKHDHLFNEVMRSNWSKMWTTEDLIKHAVIPTTNTILADYPELVFVRFDYNGNEVIAYKNKLKDMWLVKDSSGKVIKAPSYSPANLQPIIEAMS